MNYWRDYDLNEQYFREKYPTFFLWLNYFFMTPSIREVPEVSGISQILEELCQRVRPWAIRIWMRDGIYG